MTSGQHFYFTCVFFLLLKDVTTVTISLTQLLVTTITTTTTNNNIIILSVVNDLFTTTDVNFNAYCIKKKNKKHALLSDRSIEKRL